MTHREPDSVADEWLVFRCKEGSGPALEELLSRWQQRLWLHAIRVVGDEEAAQDVVQESLLAIARGIRKLDDPSRFPAWAYRIVTFKGRDWIRRQVRQRKLQEAVENEISPPSPEDSRTGNLLEALNHLDPAQRDLLRMHYHLGLSIQEIAEIEAIPAGTVKSRLHQARKELKTILKLD